MILARIFSICFLLWIASAPLQAATQWAVVVGISEYRHLPQEQWLKYAHQDARFLADLLKSRMVDVPPDNIRFLLNQEATTSNIRNAIGAWLLDNSGPEDMVYVYFACHGVVDRRNDAYFITYDTDPQRLYASAFPMLELKRILAQLKARHFVLITDACKSGSIGREQFTGRDLEAPRINDFFKGIIAENSEIQGSEFILTAAGSFEKSVESEKWGGGHGVFTYYLVEGLRGKADRDSNGRVTANEVYDFVREHVRRDTENKQNPVIAGTNFDGNLVLAGLGLKEALRQPPSRPATAAPAPISRSTAEPGTLVITSDTEGTQIVLDNKPQGSVGPSSQLILTVPSGSHSVIAQKEGLEPVSYTVEVPAGGKVAQTVTLVAAAGVLAEYQNRLSAAQQMLVKKPAEAVKNIESILENLYSLKLAGSLLPGGQEFVLNVLGTLIDEHSRKKQTARIEPLLSRYLAVFPFIPPNLALDRWPAVPELVGKLAATLHLRVTPLKSRIEIDDQYFDASSTDALRILVSPGPHRLQASTPGYVSLEQQLELGAGEAREMSLRLPLPGLNVLVLSDTAEVQVVREGGRPVPLAPLQETESRLTSQQQQKLRESVRARPAGGPLFAALLPDLPADAEELRLRFERDKYRAQETIIRFHEKLRQEIYDQRGDYVWDGLIHLEPLLGHIEISSDPAGAEVLLNEKKVGVTPLKVTRHIGEYQLTVRRGVLRSRESISIKEDATLRLERKLKPPVAFLGIHSRVVAPEKYRDLEERIKNRLPELMTHSIGEYQNPTKYEFTRDFLLGAVEESQPDLASMSRHLMAMRERFDSEIFVFGYFPSERHYLGNSLRFYVFSSHALKPDSREIQFTNQSDLDAFFKEMDAVQVGPSDLFRPYIGMRTLDTDLPARSLVVLRVDEGGPASRAGIRRGDTILKVNGAVATSSSVLEWVDKNPVGSELKLEIERSSATQTIALKSEPVPALLVTPGARTMMNNLIFQLGLLKDRMGGSPNLETDIVLLNQALAYMQFEDWKSALETLNKYSGTATGSQILRPAVNYYRGFCFEQLADKALARRWYESAARETNSLLRSHLFFDFQTLATWRLNYLK